MAGKQWHTHKRKARMRSRMLVLAAFTLILVPRDAQAHFLFIHITPPAEGGRAAEVFFSELAAAGDPQFIAKIAHTQLWAQGKTGDWQSLKVNKAADRLRASVQGSGGVVVVGSCQYGVLARPNQTPFLLRYYPKAMAGSPEELNQRKPSNKVPFEIMTAIEGEKIQFMVLREGKPVPKAEFTTVAANLSNTNLTAGDDGKAVWKPPIPGQYSVYTRWTTKEEGEAKGKKYEEIREFATLAFAWPLQRKDADPEAVVLFQDAIAARAQWQKFPGFSARIAGLVDGRPFEGKVTINEEGSVGLDTKEEAVMSWVQDQLESIVMHRKAPEENPTRPKPVLRFAEAKDDHPLGRLLIFDGGRFASSYRVKDKQIMVVNRDMGKQNFTITVLDNDRNPEGQFLPRSYTVHYWDAPTGELQRTETVVDRWQRVGDLDLPAAHTVTTASAAGFTIRAFTLSDHKLLDQSAPKKK